LNVAVLVLNEAAAHVGYRLNSLANQPENREFRRSPGSTAPLLLIPRSANRWDESVELAERWKPDVIHVHPVELWPLANAIRQRTGARIVYTVHSLNLAEYQIGQEPPEILGLWRTQQDLLAGADEIITLTESERDLLVQSCPETRGRVSIVGNGIADCDLARDAVRTRAQRATDNPLVLYSGRFVERKGIRELLAAIPMVLDAIPNARFALVGGHGSGEDIRRQWAPADLAHYTSRVLFTGWLPPDEVAKWYAAADVLVVPSWYEPFGMVILEGMLYGLPIAAAAVGGPAEIVQHKRTGLLFPPQDGNAIAESLLALLRSFELRLKLGAQAAAQVRKRWLWPHIVQQMTQVYQKALKWSAFAA
jgi:glycogen(starch) synthase